MRLVVAIVQAILHYLGWLGVILGVVAFLFGNRERAFELAIGGFAFILLKYVIGFIFVIVLGLNKKG
jgi:hypothetical protein